MPTLTSLGGYDKTAVMCVSPALNCAGRDVGISAPVSRTRRRHPKTQVSRVIPRHNSQGPQQVRVPEDMFLKHKATQTQDHEEVCTRTNNQDIKAKLNCLNRDT